MAVHITVAGNVATITLDSPENRNALSRTLVNDLRERLAEAAADTSVKVVLLRSSHRVFCSGADLSEAASTSMADSARSSVDLQRQILELPKPVVVALAGPVRAGGLGIVAASDLVIAAEDVTFAFTEARLALAPAVISLTVLPRLTSRAACDTFLSGRTFDAAAAAAMGLVTRVVPSDLAGRRGRPHLRRTDARPPTGSARVEVRPDPNDPRAPRSERRRDGRAQRPALRI